MSRSMVRASHGITKPARSLRSRSITEGGSGSGSLTSDGRRTAGESAAAAAAATSAAAATTEERRRGDAPSLVAFAAVSG